MSPYDVINNFPPHFAFQDTIMMLGELARDLPKLSDDPKDIMEKLLLPLKTHR